jgi:hypothetical protein
MTIEQIKEATERSRQAAIHAILSHAGADGQRQHDETNKKLQSKLNSAYGKSFTLHSIAGDGDCFFRALADQLVTRYPDKTLQIYEDLNLDPAETDFAMVLKNLAVRGLRRIDEKDRADTLSHQSVQAQSKDITVLAALLDIDIVPVSLDNTPQVDQVILSQSNKAGGRPTVFLAHSDGHYSSLRLQANIKIPESIQTTINDSIEMKSALGSENYYEALEMKDPASLAREGSMQRVYSSGAPQSAPSHSGGGAKVDSSQAYAVSTAAAAAQSAQPSVAQPARAKEARRAPAANPNGGGAEPVAARSAQPSVAPASSQGGGGAAKPSREEPLHSPGGKGDESKKPSIQELEEKVTKAATNLGDAELTWAMANYDLVERLAKDPKNTEELARLQILVTDAKEACNTAKQELSMAKKELDAATMSKSRATSPEQAVAKGQRTTSASNSAFTGTENFANALVRNCLSASTEEAVKKIAQTIKMSNNADLKNSFLEAAKEHLGQLKERTDTYTQTFSDSNDPIRAKLAIQALKNLVSKIGELEQALNQKPGSKQIDDVTRRLFKSNNLENILKSWLGATSQSSHSVSPRSR